MKEVDLKPSSKIKVRRDGAEYILRKPKLGEIYALEKRIKELKDSGGQGNEELITLLEQIGLPREIALDLDADEAQELLSVINVSKKNG